MSSAPAVCHIPPVTNTNQPNPTPLPSIPPAQPNLASLTATVNALRDAFQIYTGQQGQRGADGKQSPSGSWSQANVVTETVRIYNPDDKSQYVDVERINSLTWNNAATKQTITFKRPASGSN